MTGGSDGQPDHGEAQFDLDFHGQNVRSGAVDVPTWPEEPDDDQEWSTWFTV